MDDGLPSERTAATLDLGSNTFHLLLADWHAEGWRPRQCRGEVVRLAGAGAPELTDAAMARGWAALERLASDLRQASHVRVVGTQALRVAANRESFVERAQQILDHPVEVIDGREEARLIWLGATAAIGGDGPENDPSARRAGDNSVRGMGMGMGMGMVVDSPASRERVVIDIGGGSTEIVHGRGDRITTLASLPLGALTLRADFPAGRVDIGTLQVVRNIAGAAVAAGWSGPRLGEAVEVRGCSGTLQAIERVLVALGYSRTGIDRPGLARLASLLPRFGHLDAVALEGLPPRRRPLLVTGVVIAGALFDALGIERMTLAGGALREGMMEQLWRERGQYAVSERRPETLARAAGGAA